MLLAKSTLLKLNYCLRIFIVLGSFALPLSLLAQYNSPYSRYGLGDMVPMSNITSRGMGGISAGYADRVSVNFMNPASYARFFAVKQRTSSKLEHGRVVFDAGVNVESRRLIAPNTPESFTSTDAAFNYIQVGIPLRRNWGLSFGIRPLSRIGYKINRYERLNDPVTGFPIDSVVTQFNGSGGSYLPTIGTGVGIGNFSIGVNAGYLFGNRETNTRRIFLNDTVSYFASEHNNVYSFGGMFYNAGIQYQFSLKNNVNVRLGVAGNWKQNINGSNDRLVQTYVSGAAGESLQIDSVYGQNDIQGELVYPTNYTAGFVIDKQNKNKSGWLFGLDYTKGKWSDFRFFGSKDSVQDNYRLSAGGQLYPKPGTTFFSQVSYRFGFYMGKDYINVDNEMPVMGASFGMALPVRFSRMAPNQINFVNLSLEYQKRGNDDNRLKENMFRLSLGLNFTDLWFQKRRYD